MKKYLIPVFIILVIILSSCEENIEKEPAVTESERALVMQKALTDTTTIVIETDNDIYHVKDNKIVGKTSKLRGELLSFCIGLFVMLIISIAIISDR